MGTRLIEQKDRHWAKAERSLPERGRLLSRYSDPRLIVVHDGEVLVGGVSAKVNALKSGTVWVSRT